MKRTGKPAKKEAPQQKSAAAVKAAKTKSAIPLWPGLFAALLGFVLYSNTLSHEYALDDYSVILENRLTKQGWDAFPEILTTSYRFGYYFTDDDLYRPLPKAMFAAEWGMFGENASPSHWINVILFALTGWVIFRLLYRMNFGTWFALATAVLFMAHPIHTEVVANIKSRDEILALLFCLLSLDRFLFGKGSGAQIFAAGALYFLALLSKESAITFLAVFPLASWMQGGGEALRRVSKYAAPAAAAVLFLVIRASVLSGSEPAGVVSIADNLLMAAGSGAERFATAVLILGIYLKLLFIPHPLAFDYSYNQIPIVGPSDVWFLLSIAAYVFLLILGIRLTLKRHLVGFAVLFFLFTLSVYSNIFITIGSSMGERFLYMPSLGFCMALGWLISKFTSDEKAASSVNGIPKLKPAGTALMLVLTVAFSMKTFARNPVWKNNGTLYESDVLISTNSTRTHYYLGNYLVKPEASEGLSEQEQRAVIQRGITELKRSIEIYSGFADAHLQLGVAYDKLGQPDSAYTSYQRALELNPQNATIHNNIGTLYFKKNDFPNALKSFLRATELDPRYAEAHANAGSAYGMMQQYDNALSSLFQAVKWDPGYAQAYYFISITYKFKGDQKNADAYMAKAKSLDPKLN